MSVLAVALGYLLPCWVGVLIVARLLPPEHAPGRLPLLAGAGGLLGMMLVIAVTWAWGRAGFAYRGLPMLGAWSLIAVATTPWLRKYLQIMGTTPVSPRQASWHHRSVLAIVIMLIGVHVVLVTLDLISNPVFPWDATSAWATKARVWYALGEWVPFVEKDLWLADSKLASYTDHMPNYPIFTPLLQLWTALLLGSWDPSLVNLPWLLCFLCLLSLFYGGARMAGADVVHGAVFTFFLASLPLLNTHVAFAGYADLFMGAYWLAAVQALFWWYRFPSRASLACVLLFAAICPLVKNEGLFWAAALVPGVLMAALSRGRAYALLALGAGVAGALLWVFPRDLEVAGHSLSQLGLAFRAEAFMPILTSLFNLSSWHLLFSAFLLALVLWSRLERGNRNSLEPLLVVLLCAYGLFFVLFLFTGYAGGAVRFTAVSRITIALVPATLFWTMLVFSAWHSERSRGD